MIAHFHPHYGHYPYYLDDGSAYPVSDASPTIIDIDLPCERTDCDPATRRWVFDHDELWAFVIDLATAQYNDAINARYGTDT